MLIYSLLNNNYVFILIVVTVTLLLFDFFKNVDVTKQEEVDKIMLELDGTENKCK